MSLMENVSNTAPLTFIMGPCVLESRDAALEAGDFLSTLAQKKSFNLIFKSSFDKANRSTSRGFRGVGIDKGLQILEEIRNRYAIPVITDVHESHQVADVGAVADIIQIPAFLSRQTDLLVAAGKTGKYIHLKKGQFMTPRHIAASLEKIHTLTGNDNVWLCERGYTFGYENLVVDYRNFDQLKETGVPVTFDATHSVQLPGAGKDGASGGQRQYVQSLAAAAVTQRIAALYMEVHHHPEAALSDGPTSIRWSDLPALLSYLIKLDHFVKSQQPIVLDMNDSQVVDHDKIQPLHHAGA